MLYENKKDNYYHMQKMYENNCKLVSIAIKTQNLENTITIAVSFELNSHL